MKEFRQFVVENKEDIHEDSVFQMLASHGKIDECIQFAEDLKSYKKLITHFLNK